MTEGTRPTERSADVFIIAENRLLREALSRILKKKTDIEVVGSADQSQQALQEIIAAQPNILLLNPSRPALDERDYLPEIRQALPKIKVIVFGMEEDEATFFAAVRAGVVGYVLKDASACDVLTAVRSAMQGEAFCPPRLCLALFKYVTRQAWAMPNVRLRIQLGLTRREQQLIPLIARGLTNKEIASQLNLSEQTVKNYVHRMLQKSGAGGRLEIIERCQTDLLTFQRA